MKLHAILCWYDESPTWLAGCVASLTRIGVDHLIAVDGKYPHFKPGANHLSRAEQVDAITSTAMGAGVALTLHRPMAVMTEAQKRALSFRLLNASATPFEDWSLVIDADELVVDGNITLHDELRALPDSTHVAACRVTNSVDPYDRPGIDNDLSANTLELHQKMVVAAEFGSAQSRLWRALNDMTVHTTHYGYRGTDAAGKVWDLRGDIGGDKGIPKSEIARLDSSLAIQHRKNHRTTERRELKKAYYTTRDELGIERA